jgi:glycosyltransferase involved in cell wall biosynthesis
MTKPFFSIIIPSLNEEKYIYKILNNLKAQTFKDFELILVDANSADNTLKIVNQYKDKYSLKIISSKKRNLSHQRNLGAEKATGNYFFFIDADNSIPNNFLEISKKFIDENNCEAIIPKVTPENNAFFDKVSYPLSIWLVKLSLLTPRPFSTGGNLIISNAAFKKTKGFNEKVYIGEDHDMVRQLKETGAKTKLMTNTFVIFSSRRFEKEGFFTYIKYAYAFLYQILFRRVDTKIYSYEMGGHVFKK